MYTYVYIYIYIYRYTALDHLLQGSIIMRMVNEASRLCAWTCAPACTRVHQHDAECANTHARHMLILPNCHFAKLPFNAEG